MIVALEWKDSGVRLLFFQGRKEGCVWQAQAWLHVPTGLLVNIAFGGLHTRIGFKLKGLDGSCVPPVAGVPS
jgi:hypothetical protein